MATELCPYCRQRTPVMIVKKNASGLSGVQCMKCKRSYELEIGDLDQELQKAYRETLDGGNPDDAATAALRAKLGFSLETDASGALTTASLDELLANWDVRLAKAIEGISHPIARARAHEEELIRMVKELRGLQNTNAAIQAAMPIRDVSAEVAALKSDGEKSTMDLIKEARRFGTAGALGFSR
jgi:hypothetical protein